jgi:nickel transport protein
MARFSALLVVLLGVSSPAAHAHLLKVFAFAEGNRIGGITYMVGGTPASGANVEVKSADGRLLATLMPDAAGKFSYEAKRQENHVIVANTGDGHVAQWTVTAAELTGKDIRSVDINTDSTPSTNATSPTEEPGDGELAVLVEQAVARQIRPLREQLILYEDQVRLRDIVGGVGYIMGLCGFAIWWKQRQRSGS